MNWLVPFSFLVAFEILADICAKEYALHSSAKYWLLAICNYIIANGFWLMAIRRGAELARGAVLFSVVSAGLALIIGIGVYHEELTRTKMLGLGFGLIAIFLLVSE